MKIYCVMEAQYKDEPGVLRGVFLSRDAAFEEMNRLQERSIEEEGFFDSTEFFVEEWPVRDAKEG